jgi:hypothetical protein
MMTAKELYQQLSATIDAFISTAEQARLADQVFAEWDKSDIVRHVTFWHMNYADNLEAEEAKTKVPLLEGRYVDINENGVESLRTVKLPQLCSMLRAAHARIGRVVEHGKVRSMTYKEGSRRYTLKELLEVVNSHIRGHHKDLKRRSKSVI